jgi:hypothetical protein
MSELEKTAYLTGLLMGLKATGEKNFSKKLEVIKSIEDYAEEHEYELTCLGVLAATGYVK